MMVSATRYEVGQEHIIGMVAVRETGWEWVLEPALRAARTEQPAVAEMPTHPFVQPAIRLKP